MKQIGEIKIEWKACFILLVVFIFHLPGSRMRCFLGSFWMRGVRPIMIALSKLQGHRGGVPEPVTLAGNIIAALPPSLSFSPCSNFL